MLYGYPNNGSYRHYARPSKLMNRINIALMSKQWMDGINTTPDDPNNESYQHCVDVQTMDHIGATLDCPSDESYQHCTDVQTMECIGTMLERTNSE